MSARKITIAAYLMALGLGGPALLLLLAAIITHLIGADGLRMLCVRGMLLGFAIALVATGVRAVFGTMWWIQAKRRVSHG